MKELWSEGKTGSHLVSKVLPLALKDKIARQFIGQRMMSRTLTYQLKILLLLHAKKGQKRGKRTPPPPFQYMKYVNMQ